MRIRIIPGRMVQTTSICCESIIYLFVSLVETIATII